MRFLEVLGKGVNDRLPHGFGQVMAHSVDALTENFQKADDGPGEPEIRR